MGIEIPFPLKGEPALAAEELCDAVRASEHWSYLKAWSCSGARLGLQVHVYVASPLTKAIDLDDLIQKVAMGLAQGSLGASRKRRDARGLALDIGRERPRVEERDGSNRARRWCLRRTGRRRRSSSSQVGL